MKRLWIQILTFISTNAYVSGFINGKIFKGKTKLMCLPGLNCYSCPGALGSCPIGSLQAVMGSMKYQISFYVMGILMIIGTVFGRFVCSYMCPFGLLQDLLYKIKSKKFKMPKYLKYVKYGVLIYFVILIPTLFTNKLGLGDPGFCKYICPSGTFFGAIPLLIKNPGLRSALGVLFTWKMFILISILIVSVFVYRIFCRVLCPLGIIYGLFNKFSFLGYQIDHDKCTSCGACSKSCKVDLNPTKDLNSIECIRCGDCKSSCHLAAIETKKVRRK
ncbi:4Fe-4S binding protein [Acidaminobacter sp. JC074]|uniref:4Fe-4S binding protein n=1 Tax=Acidaminobacter sp. JC074 TaxID=2530199 RepID=UPI001F116C57|nr:4Fe-4S binding protein [Acidaminobacter sp. JC074]